MAELSFSGAHFPEAKAFKSWAQQTQESYQLQLALALRVSTQAAFCDDPNFLDFNLRDGRAASYSDSPEAMSHRFWVNGRLSYHDRVPDGFYLIHGMDPYVWTISTDTEEIGRVPSFESLKTLGPADDLPIEVVLIDKSRDHGLKELYNMVLSLSSSWISVQDAVFQISQLVCGRMGGAASTEEAYIIKQWKDCAKDLKDCLGSIVLPIGSLHVGLCVHRALLFKVLADLVNLPCRIVKGCKHCSSDVASSCLVKFGHEREYLVDLFAKPGSLSQPDSSLNSSSSIVISSPLSHPKFKPLQEYRRFGTLAKIYFFESQPLDLVFDNASSVDQDKKEVPKFSKNFDGNCSNKNNAAHTSSIIVDSSPSPLPGKALGNITHNRGPCITNSEITESDWSPTGKSRHDLYLDEGEWDIPWSELILKEKIGAGSFGTVHCADWRGCEVAVKILAEQDFPAECLKEFLKEVAIMKRLRHPNIVLFMGAVTRPPHLSIVTEYLSRGSLHKLLQKPDSEVKLDERRRLNMAYDVAQGMNYLHQLRPPIVHRDLKSLNLLVDSSFTVKVCDFGLSTSKANTFLSSRTATGTPEWMAPEVLRAEPSNEKSDIYSFGVILWELMTLQRPWVHMNQAQVVAAVGFKGQRLEIPSNVNPHVAALIDACWADEPSRRPSFSEIMNYLQQLMRVTQPGHSHAL